MTYTELAVVGVVVAIVVDQWVLRTKLLRRRVFWASYAIIAVFQLLVNGVLTGLPVVRYNPSAIEGTHIVYAPLEDLLFGFAMVVVTLSVWRALDRRGAPAPR